MYECDMTIDDMRKYIAGEKPMLSFKVWSYPDNKVYAMYKKIKEEKMIKYAREVVNESNR